MRKHVLVLTTTAAILACGTVAAGAQAPGDDHPYVGPGMMGPGMMSGEMMGHGWHHEWQPGGAMMAPVIGRIIFSLMDADGDGKLTLQEFQTAHERIFKAMDTTTMAPLL